jgi:hypothetical protein
MVAKFIIAVSVMTQHQNMHRTILEWVGIMDVEFARDVSVGIVLRVLHAMKDTTTRYQVSRHPA